MTNPINIKICICNHSKGLHKNNGTEKYSNTKCCMSNCECKKFILKENIEVQNAEM